ncbi:hypothetical protein [Nocardioides convexus]|uniref:hypothetical protein n=1 Tax=Nocardioides convexus TaxID=2712224 RepID=UPI0024183637|nr:hypothetical protein [Nocardioides convexus]
MTESAIQTQVDPSALDGFEQAAGDARGPAAGRAHRRDPRLRGLRRPRAGDGDLRARPRVAPLQPDRQHARRRLRDPARLRVRLRGALHARRGGGLHLARPHREVPQGGHRGVRPVARGGHGDAARPPYRPRRGEGCTTAATGWWPTPPASCLIF